MVAPLPLQQPVVDGCAQRRTDEVWIDEQWRRPEARIAVFSGDRVLADDGGVRWLHEVDRAQCDWVFLGIDAQDNPIFALTADQRWAPDELVAVRELGTVDPDAGDLRLLIGALAVLNWHATHRCCPRCGANTVIHNAGWVRRCPVDGSQHFPRVDPAVIMLVLDSDDRALLGRQPRWPATWFSTLAGFVEPGETIENAVAREVCEEVGLTVLEPRYLASQPWPFPSSLMMGFHVRAESVDIVLQDGEIAEARWFTRAQLHDACTQGAVRLPPRLSISRFLIEEWYGAELPGGWSR